MKIENVDIRINDIDHIWYNNKQYISLNRVNQMLRDKRTETQGITDEQAIEHLQSTGWMQNHDREMYESGFRECLSVDGGSYDSLIPEKHDKRTETHPCDYGKKETHGDVIYRQDAIHCVGFTWPEDAIRNLPSALTERKKGTWILVRGSNGKDYHKCSECLHTQDITGVKNYCAVCGVDMRGEEHE